MYIFDRFAFLFLFTDKLRTVYLQHFHFCSVEFASHYSRVTVNDYNCHVLGINMAISNSKTVSSFCYNRTRTCKNTHTNHNKDNSNTRRSHIQMEIINIRSIVNYKCMSMLVMYDQMLAELAFVPNILSFRSKIFNYYFYFYYQIT